MPLSLAALLGLLDGDVPALCIGAVAKVNGEERSGECLGVAFDGDDQALAVFQFRYISLDSLAVLAQATEEAWREASSLRASSALSAKAPLPRNSKAP